MSDPVETLVTPVRLLYDWTATSAQAEFLDAIQEGRLLGEHCPVCQNVYCPPSGSCARCGVETTERLDVADKGTVVTFCIVRVPSQNIEVKLPYCAANIMLDGSNMPFIGLLQEVEAEDVHVGMRVEAVWAPKSEWGPTFENIRYFRPNDEPDIPVESLGDWV